MYLDIGLVGAPGSGKDEVAKFLVEKHGFKRLAFADQIKKSYFASIGITEEKFKAARGTGKEEMWRSGLWDYSSKMKVEHGSRYFIDPVIKEVKEYPTPTVISDIRTDIELSAVKEAGVSIILVIRDFDKDFECGGSFIKETRGLGLIKLLGFPLLHNNYDNLEELHREVNRLHWQLLVTGGINGPARL
jgi:hypothetical protein